MSSTTQHIYWGSTTRYVHLLACIMGLCLKISFIMQMCTWAAGTSLTIAIQTGTLSWSRCITFKHNFPVDVGFAAVQAACSYRV